MKVEIQADFSNLIKGLDSLAKTQIPWAVTQTLNRVGEKAKEDLKSDLKNEFTLRNQYTERGIRQARAQKSDWPFVSTEVGSVSPYMGLQAVGGVKRSKGPSPLGIPLNARPSQMQIIPYGIRIHKIMSGSLSIKRNFVPIHLSDGRTMIIQHIAPKGRKNRRRNGKSQIHKPRPHTGKRGWLSVMLYKAMPSVMIPRRWRIEEIVEKSVEKNLESEFNKAMEGALKTMR